MKELIEFVMRKHGNQKRRQREPYINHVLRVAGMCESMSAKRVALCHDLLEDTDCSVEELSMYLTDEEVRAVELLTKKTSNEEYLEALLNSNNALALEVKVADAADNAAEACAKVLRAGMKVNVKGLKQALNIKGKIHHEQWADVLGYILLGASGIGLSSSLHLENITRFYIVPEHMKKLVAQSERAIHWCFFTNLEIDWTVSKNSAKNCIIKSISQEFGYTEEQAASVFETPTAVKAIDFIKEEGPAIEEHTMPLTEDVVDEDGYKVSLMPKKDIRNLYIGELTACCQKLGGAGEDVCIEGWKDKHSANYVLTTASGTVLGHFWLYETVNGGYVIDSVEARQSLDIEKLTALVKSWVSAVRPNRKLYISNCYFGITQKVIATLRKGFSLLAEEEPASAFRPKGHYSYRDSRHGVFSIN